MLTDSLHLHRDGKSDKHRVTSGASSKITLMCISRDDDALAIATDISNALPDLYICTKLMGNGHCDPLYGLDEDDLPDLVLFLQSGEGWDEELHEYAHRPIDRRPPMIVVGSKDHQGAMRVAMKAGARDFLTDPVQLDDLIESIQQVVEEIQEIGREGGANLIVFMNTKGGSGASLLANNVSHMLAEAAEQRVVLIDLDTQFGSPGQYLDLAPKQGLLEALDMIEELDEFALDGYLLTHESGLRVLSVEGHDSLIHEDLNGKHLEMLLELLAKNYDQIIVDVPRHIDPLTTTALEHADKVVLVTQQSVTHISDTTHLMKIICQDLQIDKAHIVPIVNRYQKNTAVTLADIEKAFQGIVPKVITNDFERVNDSINNGVPLYKFAKSAQITKEILKLSTELSGASVPEKKGLFGRLKARL